MKTNDHSDPCYREDTAADLETPVVIEQEYKLDASVSKVWRAISVPALRAHWLPDLDLAAPDPVHAVPEQEVRYVMRERQPPFIESEVTLHIRSAPGGGTILTIIHAISAASEAANDSGTVYMRAA